VPEPSPPLSDAEVARELAAISARLAALPAQAKGRDIAEELISIRADLRRLAEENDAVRRRLGVSLGLRLDDRSPGDT
jgi:hypothetical protein